MATLGLKEIGIFLWEGRQKSWPNWLSQFSFAKLRQSAEFFWKMQNKNLVFHFRGGRHTVGQIPPKCKETLNLMWFIIIDKKIT